MIAPSPATTDCIVTESYLKDCVNAYRIRTGSKNSSIRAALFDMDGTLYDSMPSHARAWMMMCEDNGLQASVDEFFLFEGRTGASTLDILFSRQYGTHPTEQQVKELYRQKTVNFRSLPPVNVMPGAQQLTRHCVDAGLKCVLVTGSGQSSLISRLDTDYPGVFNAEESVTSRHVTHGKPHPEPYLLAMHRAEVTPFQAIVFENAPLGVQAGVDSGAFTVAVLTGPVPRSEMVRSGASVIFNSMPECTFWFPKLLYMLNR